MKNICSILDNQYTLYRILLVDWEEHESHSMPYILYGTLSWFSGPCWFSHPTWCLIQYPVRYLYTLAFSLASFRHPFDFEGSLLNIILARILSRSGLARNVVRKPSLSRFRSETWSHLRQLNSKPISLALHARATTHSNSPLKHTPVRSGQNQRPRAFLSLPSPYTGGVLARGWTAGRAASRRMLWEAGCTSRCLFLSITYP